MPNPKDPTSTNDDISQTTGQTSPDDVVLNNNSPQPFAVSSQTSGSNTQDLFNQSTTPPPQVDQVVNPNNVVLAPHTPKKYGGKKVIATIFGLVFLVGAVSIGVYLVRQQQLLQQQAASGRECQQSPDCVLLDNPGNEGSFDAPRPIIRADITDQEVHGYGIGESDDGCRRVTIRDNYISWNKYGSGNECKDISNVQVWLGQPPQPSNTPTPTEIPSPTPTTPPGITPSATPTTNPSPSPTTPPSITAQCSAVTAYDVNWNTLSATELSSLEEGDLVRFAVSGSASGGSFNKARFSVNGQSIGESLTKKPGSDEFYKEYTIPAGTVYFEVKGEVFHSTLGWL